MEGGRPTQAQPTKLIPTRSKEKLPRGFSYPVGAAQLSEALADVPGITRMTLVFRWRDEFRASKYRKTLQTAGEMSVLHLESSAPTVADRSRALFISAVPTDHAHDARIAVFAEALPRLASVVRRASIEDDFIHFVARYDLALRGVRIDEKT